RRRRGRMPAEPPPGTLREVLGGAGPRVAAGHPAAGRVPRSSGRTSWRGSPTEVVDEMERWIDETGADGFNLAYAVSPGTFEQVAELVVPELRRRGRMPAEPPTGTLREVLGGAGPRVAAGHPAAGRVPRSS
ncbi:MAG: ssuD, partial [Actinomycetospora sp.]|nr:ssuD [Actinomycetospora sp.]